MSATVAVTGSASEGALAPRASFVGLLRGELRKIARLRIVWVIVGVMTALVVGGQIVLATGPNVTNQLRSDPLDGFMQAMSGDVAIVRIFSGIFALTLAAYVVGLEYQYGTIRILLGRGVGRLQLLGAKVTALALVGLAFVVVESLIEAVFLWGIVVSEAGGSQPWNALTGEFWGEARIFALYLALNLGVTLALGVAAAVVGRSLAFGLAVGLSWFAVDNLLTVPLSLLVRFTHSDFWANVSGALLGPLLNRLPDYIAPPYHVTAQGPHGVVTLTHTISGFGPMPLIHVAGGQALLVIAVWTALFVVVAVTLTARRDVME